MRLVVVVVPLVHVEKAHVCLVVLLVLAVQSYLLHHPQTNAVSAIVETMSVPLMRLVVVVVPLVHVEKAHVCFVVHLDLALQLQFYQPNNAIFAACQIMRVLLMRLVVVVVLLVHVEKAHVCLVVLLVLVFQSTGLRKENRHFLPEIP